ncbi:TetR/AcrR family transcriptional regulator [Mycobacteroides salmoniphilum]|nr:TetR family transcriptional regulator [Mycobacteroides salmoniphilum]
MQRVRGGSVSRRGDVINSAIELLGTRGEHAVTHNRVDAAAGVSRGTTSNYFRKRDALLLAICTETQQRRLAAWDALFCPAGRNTPVTIADLNQLLTRHIIEATSTGTVAGVLARAHNALCVMAHYKPFLRDVLVASERQHRQQLHSALQAAAPSWMRWRTEVLASWIAAATAQQFTAPTREHACSRLGPLLDALAAAQASAETPVLTGKD